MPVHVLLVDPNRARRQTFEAALTLDAYCTSIGDATEAAAAKGVDVAVISLRQTVGHGLELGRALKLKYPAATVVVFGKIEGEGASTTRVKERWGIDVHMPFLPQPADVAALVDTVRLARARDVAKEAARLRPPEPRRADPAWRELLTEPITSETFKTILRKDLLAR